MTEMVTGVDLIAEQIRAAQGEVLRLKQEDIQLKVRQCSPGNKTILSRMWQRIISSTSCNSNMFTRAIAGIICLQTRSLPDLQLLLFCLWRTVFLVNALHTGTVDGQCSTRNCVP